MIKKAMLSQPMAGKTDEEIVATREMAVSFLESAGYEIVNTLFTDEWYSRENMEKRGVVQIPLCFLAKSLENMKMPEDAGLNTMPQRHMDLKSFMKNRRCNDVNSISVSKRISALLWLL